MDRFIDLFAGIGGFRVALQGKGLKCVYSCEIDKPARDMYKKNFGHFPEGADILDVNAQDIPEHDILCGGFPCQPFSIAGKKGGLSDDRGQLFFEIIRIVKHHKPKVLLLENVRNILSIDGGGVLDMILDTLNKEGYNVRYALLNASDYGIPQARKRVYFTCIRKDLSLAHTRPKPINKINPLCGYMEDVIDSSLCLKDSVHVIYTKKISSIVPSNKTIRVAHHGNGGQTERIYSCYGHAITQHASSGGGLGNNTGLYLDKYHRIRKLSQAESKKVMGYNTDHQISVGKQGYRQLGNAVVPPMIEQVYNSLF